MADYFPLLSRTIASLGNSTAEQRQVVYQRARIVVETQLSAIDPPMDPDAIAKELELFEQSVVKLENEMLSLESLKGDLDEDVTREHSTRRHISARLSDLMAKAAAARTAATQERLKADLPPLNDPSLSGPAVKVDAVPVPVVDAQADDPFIDHDGDAVDHPLVQTSVIEGDPLDALAEAHVRKLAEAQTSDLDQVSKADNEALVDRFNETGLSSSSDEQVQPAEALPSLPMAPSPDPIVVDTPSGLLADVTSGEVRGRAGTLPADNFSLIPWLSQDFTAAPPQEPSVPDPDLQSDDRQAELFSDDETQSVLIDDAGAADQAVSASGVSSTPEMPQALTDVVSQTGEASVFWHGWAPHKDAPDDAAISTDEGAKPLLAMAQPDAEMDAEAAKAAFWGEAYQPKKDENEAEASASDEAEVAVNETGEDAAAAGLLELTEDESRPRLLQKRRLDRAMVRKLVMVAVFASVIAAVGVTAWILRDQPSDFEQNAGLQRTDLSRKINDRLPSDNAPQAEAAKAATPSGQISGQRAILLEEIPEGQVPPPPVIGQVSWSLDTIRDVNGAGDVAVKAEVKGLSGSLTGMSLTFKRNRDLSFPASHLLEVTFVTPETSANGRVRDITLPEMRVDETTRGAALFGLPVPVTDNVFLIGLTNLPDRIEFNIDLLRSRKWLVIPVRFANGRRAALMIEKGLAGDRALLDAFQAWK